MNFTLILLRFESYTRATRANGSISHYSRRQNSKRKARQNSNCLKTCEIVDMSDLLFNLNFALVPLVLTVLFLICKKSAPKFKLSKKNCAFDLIILNFTLVPLVLTVLFHCRDRPQRCSRRTTKKCSLSFRGDKRQWASCQTDQCPNSYPWVNNLSGN